MPVCWYMVDIYLGVGFIVRKVLFFFSCVCVVQEVGMESLLHHSLTHSLTHPLTHYFLQG
jgi:hypothetical protein